MHLSTVGHSNHPLERFLAILEAHGVERVVDVRRFPVSRRWPHFDTGRLGATLSEAGRSYVGMPELGGRRKPRPKSPHTAWRVDAFRGYADFMDSPEFAAALERLEALAREKPSAILCAEALPWRCHRSMIADALVVAGWEVSDALSQREARPHRLPEFARVEGQRILYDAGQRPLADSFLRGPG